LGRRHLWDAGDTQEVGAEIAGACQRIGLTGKDERCLENLAVHLGELFEHEPAGPFYATHLDGHQARVLEFFNQFLAGVEVRSRKWLGAEW
jgi:hypothetical protein